MLPFFSPLFDADAYWLYLLKGENCFYYWLLYDRFTRTIYDVIESAHVQHLPASLAKLMKPFKFVLMESGKSAEVTETLCCCSFFFLMGHQYLHHGSTLR